MTPPKASIKALQQVPLGLEEGVAEGWSGTPRETQGSLPGHCRAGSRAGGSEFRMGAWWVEERQCVGRICRDLWGSPSQGG